MASEARVSFATGTVDTQHGRIAYRERGSGPPALFIHGVLLNSLLWTNVIERLSDLRRCIAIDLLCHGSTRTATDADVSLAGNADMLEGFCDALGLGAVDLVANDSGGGIAQILAARHPERLRTLTLTNCDVHDNWPPAAFQPMHDLVAEGGLGEMLKGMLKDLDTTRQLFSVAYEHPERISDEMLRSYLGPLVQSPESEALLERWFASMDPAQTVAVEPMLRRLKVPTLIVWGTGDIFFDVKWARWLQNTIPGTVEVVELPGARLFFPQERPDELADAIRGLWSA